MQAYLQQTRTIQAQISDEIRRLPVVLEACPQRLYPLCGRTPVGSRWLAMGSAAIAFDPICGDGVGAGIRTAILANAVLTGMATGLPLDQGLQHYTQRLQHTFWSHLRACLNYYESSFSSSGWTAEINLMQDLHRQHSRAFADPKFTYGLRHLKLVPL